MPRQMPICDIARRRRGDLLRRHDVVDVWDGLWLEGRIPRRPLPDGRGSDQTARGSRRFSDTLGDF